MSEEREFSYKIADHSYETIKFALTLYVRVVAFFFMVSAVFAALLTAEAVEPRVLSMMRNIGTILSGGMVAFTAITFYLVHRAAAEYISRLEALSPSSETDKNRFSRAHVKIMIVGFGLGIGATVVFFYFLTFFRSGI